jgi:hypothetical protein
MSRRRPISLVSFLLAPLFLVASGRDARAQSVQPPTVVVPVVSAAPTWDPTHGCLGDGWSQAALVPMPGTSNFVEILRTDTDAYFCFYGVTWQNNSTPVTGPAAGVLLDPQDSRATTISLQDLTFTVAAHQSTPSAAAWAGDVLGSSWAPVPASDYQAWSNLIQEGEFSFSWDAMLRINVAAFGGKWGPSGAVLTENDHVWPSSTTDGKNPSTWGVLDFGGSAPATPVVTGFSPSDGDAPQLGRPGTTVTIGGRFLDQVSNVYFNYDHEIDDQSTPVAGPGLSAAKILSQSSDQLVVEVPRLALTGPIELRLNDGKTTLTTSSPFTVRSYRNQYGYQFGNWPVEGFGDITWTDMTNVWGWDQMYTLGIFPSIEAAIFYIVAVDVLDASGGHCWGMAYTSLQMKLGDQPLPGPFTFDLPPGNVPFQLSGYGLPDPTLFHYISGWHTAQFSVEGLHAYIRNNISASTSPLWAVDTIKGEITNGRPLLVDIREGATLGHVVVAYDVVANPAWDSRAAYAIRVYDPNHQFGVFDSDPVVEDSELDPHGLAHRQLELGIGTIYVRADGTWWFPDAGAGGGPGGITPILYGDLPTHHPTMPGSIEGLVLVGFGSASTTQVSDDAGHTLLNADGTQNRGATALPSSAIVPPFSAGDAGAPAPQSAQPVIAYEGTGALHEVLHNTGDGTYTHAFMGRGVVASLEGMTATAGVDDTVRMETDTGSFTFQTGAASKPFAAKLYAKAGASGERGIEVSGATTYASGGETLGVAPARDSVVYQHAGHETDAVITLRSVSAKGQTQFVTRKMRFKHGDQATFTPASWDDLGATKVKVHVKHADGCDTDEELDAKGASHGHAVRPEAMGLDGGAANDAPQTGAAADDASAGGCGIARGARMSGGGAWLAIAGGIVLARRRRARSRRA